MRTQRLADLAKRFFLGCRQLPQSIEKQAMSQFAVGFDFTTEEK